MPPVTPPPPPPPSRADCALTCDLKEGVLFGDVFRVHLTRVPALVGRSHGVNVQVPRAAVLVRHSDPGVGSDPVGLNGEHGGAGPTDPGHLKAG